MRPPPTSELAESVMAHSVERRGSWRRHWTCHTAMDEATGKRYWLARCMGGAVYGKRGCTCDPYENECKARNEYS